MSAAHRIDFRFTILAAFAIDILFLPFLLPVPVPISAFLIPVWLIFGQKPQNLRVMSLSLAGASIALLSYLYGSSRFNFDIDTSQTRFINTAILMFMFASYSMITEVSIHRLNFITRILEVYLIFCTILASIFILTPEYYFTLRSFWTFSGEIVNTSEITTLTRYAGILSDPNNCAASSCAIAAFIVFFTGRRFWANLLWLGMAAIIVVATMSATGFICLIILMAAFFWKTKLTGNVFVDVPFKVILVVTGVAVAGFAYSLVESNMIFSLAAERISDSDLDSRISRWVIVLDIAKVSESLLLGDGGSIVWQTPNYKPHNGHLHLIFSYGIFLYGVFVAQFFTIKAIRNWDKYVFLIIILIVFTVNVGIYEHRFCGIWVLLLCGYNEYWRGRSRDRA